MLKNFPHPLVIKYIDSFKDSDENAYLVTEFAESLDLKNDMIKKFSQGKGYCDIESQNIILQFCLGLLHMHKNNMIHRDIKPENIFLVKLSESKILYKIGDPGIAKNIETIILNKTNTLGQAMTIKYASPEQILLQTPTKKMDSWAVGIIYY